MLSRMWQGYGLLALIILVVAVGAARFLHHQRQTRPRRLRVDISR